VVGFPVSTHPQRGAIHFDDTSDHERHEKRGGVICVPSTIDGQIRRSLFTQVERFQRQPFVMSAKAGIPLVAQISWIPAFAGMTDKDSWNKNRSI
jgi:hypothetical protein